MKIFKASLSLIFTLYTYGIEEADTIETIINAPLLTSTHKSVHNMILTSVTIKLGRVKGNRMVNMQLSNNKLVQRGIDMIVKMGNVDALTAEELLKKRLIDYLRSLCVWIIA